MTKKARVRAKPAKGSSAREQAGHGQCLYASLPSEAVTKEMLDGLLSIDALQMTIAFPHVKRSHVVAARRDPRINLYALNKPLEEIQVEYMRQQNEILVLRNRLMLMAIRLGLADEVPSMTVHTTWPQLADKIWTPSGREDAPSWTWPTRRGLADMVSIIHWLGKNIMDDLKLAEQVFARLPLSSYGGRAWKDLVRRREGKPLCQGVPAKVRRDGVPATKQSRIGGGLPG